MVLLILMRWVFAHKSPSELGEPCQGATGSPTSSMQALWAFFAVALGAAVKHSEVASLLLLTGDENKASLSSPLPFMDQWTALRHWIEAHGLVVSVLFIGILLPDG